MRAEDAPRALFPEATAVTERSLAATAELQSRMRALLGTVPTAWEAAYPIFTARRGDEVVGFVTVVDEIGKHRPITFAVAVRPDRRVHDLAVLAYREAYGGEVRERRFLKQYGGKAASDPL